jgi:DNA-binding CsgD family transcriptional regulator
MVEVLGRYSNLRISPGLLKASESAPSERHPRAPNPRQRRLQELEVRTLVDRYADGETIADIAASMQIGITTVKSHLRRAGAPLRGRTRSIRGRDLTHAAELYLSGLSLREVAERTGFGREALRNALRTSGVIHP